jgi:hypothetical protein
MCVDGGASIVASFFYFLVRIRRAGEREREREREREEGEEEKSLARQTGKCFWSATCSLSRERTREEMTDSRCPFSLSDVFRLEHYLSSLLFFILNSIRMIENSRHISAIYVFVSYTLIEVNINVHVYIDR